MKRSINYVVIVLLLLIIPLINVSALSVSKNDLTIEKGGHESVELSTDTEKNIISVKFTLVYTTYDIPGNFSPAEGFNDTDPNGITHEIIFDKPQTGKIVIGSININVLSNAKVSAGTVNIHTATAKTTEGEVINLNNQNINIKIGTPVKEEPKSALLSKIESKLVNIELTKDIFEYNITIDSNVKELDLKAVPKDENAKVEISTQKVEEIQDNKIIITVKNGTEEKKYTINVTIKEKKDNKIVIDKNKFKEDKSYKGKWIIISIFLIVALMVSLILSRKK